MAFILNKTEHTAGDHRCVECWGGFPVKCVCGGFIHAQFVKETWQKVIDLAYSCDSCGEKYAFPKQNFKPKFKSKPGKQRRPRQV